MSAKLRRLAERMSDLVARRTELRFRVAGSVKRLPQIRTGRLVEETLAIGAVNEIAEISEEIGQLQVAMADEQGRMERERREKTDHGDTEDTEKSDPADPGVPVDLVLHSGPCIECGQSSELDGSGRCALCEILVASPRT